MSLIAGALELLAFVETNITDLRWSMEETQLVTQQNIETNTILQKSVLNLDAAISEMVRHSFTNVGFMKSSFCCNFIQQSTLISQERISKASLYILAVLRRSV